MKKIAVPVEGVATVFGSYDDNLRFLETLLNVSIRTEGHDLLVEGDPGGMAKLERLVGQLGSLIDQGYSISNGDVRTASSSLLTALTSTFATTSRRLPSDRRGGGR